LNNAELQVVSAIRHFNIGRNYSYHCLRAVRYAAFYHISCL